MAGQFSKTFLLQDAVACFRLDRLAGAEGPKSCPETGTSSAHDELRLLLRRTPRLGVPAYGFGGTEWHATGKAFAVIWPQARV
jgi:hypothetical protein